MHEATDREVRHHEPVELLRDEVRGLAAQDDSRATQMCLKFVECRFDLPSLMVQGRQFCRGGLIRVRDSSQKPVRRLRVGNTLKGVFNYSYDNSVTAVTPVLIRAVDRTQKGAVCKGFLARETKVLLHSPQYVRSC